jgi:hypothetical protein
MHRFYSIPTATLAANPPAAMYHATPAPGAPAVSLVVVEAWDGHANQDAWEALPGVQEFYIENWGALAPPGVITAFAPWGATTGMTLRQISGVIRKNWPIWRP